MRWQNYHEEVISRLQAQFPDQMFYATLFGLNAQKLLHSRGVVSLCLDDQKSNYWHNFLKVFHIWLFHFDFQQVDGNFELVTYIILHI